jgi:hypothetical protein
MRRLDGYHSGLGNLVPISRHVEEGDCDTLEPLTEEEIQQHLIEYSPYKHHDVIQQCFLDQARTLQVPKVHAYQGIPQYHPNPLHGSYQALSLRDDICFDSHGRFGAYGLETYEEEERISRKPRNTTRTIQVDWSTVNWGAAQAACHKANRHRFSEASHVAAKGATASQTISRSAIVLRTWIGYDYTPLVIKNLRALLSEVALGSGGEYDVHLLVHVKDNSMRFWESSELYHQIRNQSVPAEFRNLVTLWSERHMEMVYPGPFLNNTINRSGRSIHGVYRSSHMPLQYFAATNPQYEHFWNWEMDIRYTGHYYEFFDRVARWANAQPTRGIWERNAKYYLEKLHGNWLQFTETTREENPQSVWGPVPFPGSRTLDPHGSVWTATNTSHQQDADLITLSPLFDPNNSRWYFADDITGYDLDLPSPPRRVAIIAASRLSRRLLHVMHEETFQHKRSMWTEMWAPSIALHYGLKAVYAPHPVYYDRKWPVATAGKIFNAGIYGSSGGNASSVFGAFEHNHLGSTWYHNARFAGQLWNSWLGVKDAQSNADRMCLRSMLLHPIKHG